MSEPGQNRYELLCNRCGYRRGVDADLIGQMSKILNQNITVTALSTEDKWLSRITCSKCGARGTEITLSDRSGGQTRDDTIQWCHVCGSSIEVGRLEVLPDTNLCTTCMDTPVYRDATNGGSCPRCRNGKLVRDSKRRRTRTRLLRCSRFPHCEYSESV